MSSSWEGLYSNEISCYINDFIKRYRRKKLPANDLKILVDKYSEWNTRYSKSVKPYIGVNFSRRVLYYIADRMFWSRFEDSSYVELVLSRIFEVNESLVDIISPSDKTFPSIFRPQEQTEDFAKFFLEHAYRRKLLFDGCRLPHSIIVQPYYPFLLQMLRFGAMFSCGNNCSGFRVKRSHYNVPYSCIKQIYYLNPSLLPPSLLPAENELTDLVTMRYNTYGNGNMYDYFVLYLKLLLTDISMLSVDALHKQLCDELHKDLEECPGKEDIIDFTRKFSANVVDDFENHFVVPLSLKRFCRLVIRRELNKNWALPEGICLLPIPEYLKRYLDV